MALQGTIDSFPLTDVLHLLSASARSGRLVLDGDRGTATLWIEDGRVVGGGPRVTPSAPAPSLVFEMLRFDDGSFVFDAPAAGERPEVQVEPTPLLECVEAAKALHDEWAQLLAVVPSADHRVRLAPALRSGPVTIDPETWTVLVAAAERPSVSDLADRLDLDEYGATARIAELIAAELLDLDPPDPSAGSSSTGAPVGSITDLRTPSPATAEEVRSVAPEERRGLERSTPDPDRSPPAFPDRFPIDDLIGGGAEDAADPWTSNGADLDSIHFTETAARRDFDHAPIPDTSWDELLDDALDAADRTDDAPQPVPDSTDEVMRQMSKLSPQAAEAIAAALNSGSRPDRDEDGGPDGPTSFLGSF